MKFSTTLSNQRTLRRIAEHIDALGSPDDGKARHAEACLIRYYGLRSTEMLIAACDSPNPKVRFRAVWVLGKSRDMRTYETILRLTEDRDSRVRYDAALALGLQGDQRAVEPLLALALRPDPEGAADSAAMSGLQQMGETALRKLRLLLESDQSTVRVQVADVLGRLCEDQLL